MNELQSIVMIKAVVAAFMACLSVMTLRSPTMRFKPLLASVLLLPTMLFAALVVWGSLSGLLSARMVVASLLVFVTVFGTLYALNASVSKRKAV